jgi:hypothetical protein
MKNDGGLRKEFRKHLKKVHWVTIESRFTEFGIPDLNGALGGREFWLEFKTTKHWTVKIRPAQVAWILRRCRTGGHVYIGIRRKNKIDDELWLVHGVAVQILLHYGLNDLPDEAIAGCWHGGPSEWDWDEVKQALIH